MKNFKKAIILSIIIVIIIIYAIYNYLSVGEDEFIEEDLYVETNTNVEEKNIIILHITGEVNKPRNNTNSWRHYRICRHK